MYHKRGTLTYLTRHRQAVIQREQLHSPHLADSIHHGGGAAPHWPPAVFLAFYQSDEKQQPLTCSWAIQLLRNTPIAAAVRQIRKTQKYVDSRIEKSRPTLKRTRRHVDEILVAGCTASYQKYKFQCSRWRNCPQNDISVPISSTYWWYCVQLNRWNAEWYFQKLGMSSVTYTTQ